MRLTVPLLGKAIPVSLVTVLLAPCVALGAALPGFERSRHFDEQIKTYSFDPDVNVHINAPSADEFDPDKRTRLVIYALPNGNSIAQTIGRQPAPDLDWHFLIQHIGAQTRRVREVIKDQNLVVAYLEAGRKSWPSWRKNHADSGARLAELIGSVRSQLGDFEVTVDLTSHSGGGSLIFGYLNQVDEIPAWIGRIVFLDSNYGYSEEQGHADKLIAWLRRSPDHHLGVIAYDDRRIRVDDKLVVGPTGGTFRKTRHMIDRLGRDVPLTEEESAEYTRFRGMNGRIDIIVLNNPDDKILHTVLVEKNGFIHSLTFATPYENQAGKFYGPSAYQKWIQPD